ncbi:beta-ketoacyl synthase [bacterium]|nr:beta-ketoacyl synthase [bacterium]
MKSYIAADNMITSLGFSTSENMQNLKAGNGGVQMHTIPELPNGKVPLSLVNEERLEQLFSGLADGNHYTKLEKLAISSIHAASQSTEINLAGPETLFILSTTKGNIELLGSNRPEFGEERQRLWSVAHLVSRFFKNPNPPLVVSNACISGILALLTGQRLISENRYRHIVVTGVDIATHFVVSGFQSFKALSPNPCKPFDSNRDGLSLGEGVGTVLLTSDAALCPNQRLVVRGGASANDANHISGPSRDGEGLFLAIENTIRNTSHSREQIDYISAHGTGTRYNDNMESMAFHRAGLDTVPVNSLKGYFGHTLGAAGILETIVCFQSMRERRLLKTKGCEDYGTAKPINVIQETQSANITHCLKVASGFGGCNAGLLISQDGTF